MLQPEAAPASALAVLPQDILADILWRSGLHARLVCRAFRDLHRPLTTVAIHSFLDPEALQAALATLPPSLTSLDLRAVFRDTITPAVLATVPAALPLLQHLALPACSLATLPGVLDTLSHLPHFHTLHAPLHARGTWRPMTPPWPTLLHPNMGTRLRSLTLPLCALDALQAARPSALPHLATATFCRDGLASKTGVSAACLASLASPAPALRSLAVQLGTVSLAAGLRDCSHLAALTALTALTLSGLQAAHPATTAQALHAIGALTALRSLRLCLQFTGTWRSPADGRGWLARLSLLTSLDVTIAFHVSTHGEPPLLPAQDAAAAGQLLPEPAVVISDVVRGVVRLRHLRDLQLGFRGKFCQPCPPAWLACGTPNSFFRHLAAATQLHRLRLSWLTLPPAEACLLAHLHALTSLRLTECHEPQGADDHQPQHGGVLAAHDALLTVDTHWVGGLVPLQELVIDHCPIAPHVLQRPPLAALPHLHTLVLRQDLRQLDSCTFGAGHLLELLAGLQHALVRLDLSGTHAVDAHVLRVLEGMRRLRVLSLCERGPTHSLELLWLVQDCYRALRLPPCLQRCYLPVGLGSAHMDEALAQLHARYPRVNFKLHGRRDDCEW